MQRQKDISKIIKMKINYISTSAWWDTDRTVLPIICDTFDITFLGLNQGEKGKTKSIDLPWVEKLCNDVVIMNQNKRGRSIATMFQTFLYCLKILKIIRSNDRITFYTIGANNLYFSLFLFFLLKKSSSVIVVHNYIEHIDKRLSLFTIMKKLYYHRFRHFCFYSDIQKNLFLNKYKKNAYTLLMPLKDFGKPSVVRNYEKIVLLFFGIIREYKGLDLLIEAMNIVRPQNIRVVIAGQCKNWERYENKIEQHDNYMCKIGFISDDDVPNYFCNSDFLVLPYLDSTQSGPSLIGINYGIPIIASDLENFSSIISDGKNGFLFEKGSVRSLCNVLKKVDSMTKIDINQMKSHQIEYKRNYSNNNILIDFESIVNEVLS